MARTQEVLGIRTRWRRHATCVRPRTRPCPLPATQYYVTARPSCTACNLCIVYIALCRAVPPAVPWAAAPGSPASTATRTWSSSNTDTNTTAHNSTSSSSCCTNLQMQAHVPPTTTATSRRRRCSTPARPTPTATPTATGACLHPRWVRTWRGARVARREEAAAGGLHLAQRNTASSSWFRGHVSGVEACRHPPVWPASRAAAASCSYSCNYM